MSITKKETEDIFKKYGKTDTDSGSSEVQIAILTKRINNITEHLQSNKKDYSARRGLIQMVSTRRKLLSYVKRRKNESYDKIIKELGIRK